MAEDERTVDEQEVAGVGGESPPDTTAPEEAGISIGAEPDRGPDDAAETFLELDEELDRTTEPDGTSGPRRGLLVDAERVDAASVPAGYPLSAATDRAVALTVDFGAETTTVYLAWPDDADSETPLTWLLDAMGIDVSDLYGTTVLVERSDGHDVLVTPDERPRGADMALGVAGGLGLAVGIVGLTAAIGSLSTVAFLLWLAVTLGWLPYATYRDAWYARTHSDWTGGPVFWATLMFVPVLNLGVGVAYLVSRSRATFFDGRRSLLGRVRSRIREWL